MSNRFALVKDHPSLVRDITTGAILNTDEATYSEHVKKKALNKHRLEKEQTKEERINKLEGQVKELGTKLDKILDILSNGNT